MEKLIESAGGRLEAFYFAFGENDVYSLVDLPDHASVAAAALAVTASGASRVRTIVLLTPEEVEQTAKKTVQFRPPGR